MATARNLMSPRMFTIRPSMAGIERISSAAARWRQAYFYADDLRISVSNVERPELQDLWVLTTDGSVTAYEIRMMLIDEL